MPFAAGREVVNHVLQPSEAGIAWRRAVCPTWVVWRKDLLHQSLILNGGFAINEIHFLSICCAALSSKLCFAEVVINAANRHIHRRKFPCGGVDSSYVYGKVIDVALMCGSIAGCSFAMIVPLLLYVPGS